MTKAAWRLFAAFLPSDDAITDLDAAVAPLRDGWTTLRWTPPRLWHLTGAFFGEVAEERAHQLAARLERVAARHAPVQLRFAGGGAFSRPAKASVVYAGVDGALPRLRALADSCAAAGRRVGLAMEERAFRPHLTLARAKGRTPVDVRPIVERLDGYAGPTWTSSEIVLMRSHLGPQPRHEPVGRWPLAGTDQRP
ncbi:MAG TPA: RNA 2',3'-cyclic phosphodiesterase [Acidothermaceae bacterium]|jgi:2'-5' RNA ligase